MGWLWMSLGGLFWGDCRLLLWPVLCCKGLGGVFRTPKEVKVDGWRETSFEDLAEGKIEVL